ncbi:MAG: 1-deoxy-D-xylulose-5-phosphate reductoisomerase [Bacillota bacterium]|nr:1-deoxy-D-xylulose-5-phosphate reductoisomerase [Bacillota bacterium]
MSEPAVNHIAILGASGSIGRQALEICRLHSGSLRVGALTAGANWRALADAVREFRPRMAVIVEPEAYAPLKAACGDCATKLYAGAEYLPQAAADSGADMLLAAISGSAGLPSLVAALEAGIDVALANKEALVAAGALVKRLCAEHGSRLYAVDSEHSALQQCLRGEERQAVRRLILTASGGAFRELSYEQLAAVKPEEALHNPNWQMGAKVTVDSATMVNKGLELIEASWLFDIEPARISALLHPQSIVHSLVEYVDGSVKAQLSQPDMRLPIQYALLRGQRRPSPLQALDLEQLGRLDFQPIDRRKYPAVELFRQAAQRGGAAAAYLNAANEQLVKLFLAGLIGFTDISDILTQLADGYRPLPANSLEQILSADAQARMMVKTLVKKAEVIC